MAGDDNCVRMYRSESVKKRNVCLRDRSRRREDQSRLSLMLHSEKKIHRLPGNHSDTDNG